MRRLFTILLLTLIGVTTTFGLYTEYSPQEDGTTNLVIHLREDHEEFHCYWETGNYSSNIVANLVAKDIKSVEFNLTRVDTNNLNRTTRKWITRKYTWAMTNQVHWMKAHPATTNDPYIVVSTWHEWGYVNLYWKEKLTDTKWERIIWGKKRHDPRVPCRTTIYMHPESSITKRMLKATTGFFCQSPKGPYTYTPQNRSPRVHEHLYRVDLDNFFPKPVVDTVPSRSSLGITMTRQSSSPTIPGR